MGIYREGRRPEGYIPINLRTPAGGTSLIYTDWTWFSILYIMLNFDEVYISDIPPAVSIATWYMY